MAVAAVVIALVAISTATITIIEHRTTKAACRATPPTWLAHRFIIVGCQPPGMRSAITSRTF
jgi:hypothetical protein